MKKLKIYFAYLLLCCGLLTGCNKGLQLSESSSESSVGNDACRLILSEPYDRKNGSMSVCIRNSTDRAFGYGNLFRIYKYDKKRKSYERMQYCEGIGFTLVMYDLDPGSEKTLELPIEFAYGKLSIGKYRLEIDVTDQSNGANSTLTLSFQVELKHLMSGVSIAKFPAGHRRIQES